MIFLHKKSAYRTRSTPLFAFAGGNITSNPSLLTLILTSKWLSVNRKMK